MTSPAITSEVQKFAPSAMVELFSVDLTTFGDTVYNFHAGKNGLSADIVWQGVTYTAYPVQASGFDYNVNSQIPRPKITFSNTTGLITALILLYTDLVGAKVTRRRTLAKFLDAVNFTGGVNPTADPTASMPDEVYFINQKTSENKNAVEFELTAAFDVMGVQLPRRQIVQNICTWKYRSSECSYAGPPVAKADDTALTTKDAVTSFETAYITTWNAYLAAIQATANANTTLATATNALNDANNTPQLLSDHYSLTAPTYYVAVQSNGNTIQTLWNGGNVTIGATYRKGAVDHVAGAVTYYHIQQWGPSSAAVATATTAYNAAVTALTSAKTAQATALTNYNTAVGALPGNSPLYSLDVCGKRISSCNCRFAQSFQEGILPYGGFPAAGTGAI